MPATIESLKKDAIVGDLSNADPKAFVALQANGATGYTPGNAFFSHVSNRIYYVGKNFSENSFGKKLAIMGHEVTHHLGKDDPKAGVALSPINNAHRREDYYEFR